MCCLWFKGKIQSEQFQAVHTTHWLHLPLHVQDPPFNLTIERSAPEYVNSNVNKILYFSFKALSHNGNDFVTSVRTVSGLVYTHQKHIICFKEHDQTLHEILSTSLFQFLLLSHCNLYLCRPSTVAVQILISIVNGCGGNSDLSEVPFFFYKMTQRRKRGNMLQKFTGLEFFLLLNMYSSSVGTVVQIKKSALQQYIMKYLESIDYDSLGWEIHFKQYLCRPTKLKKCTEEVGTGSVQTLYRL